MVKCKAKAARRAGATSRGKESCKTARTRQGVVRLKRQRQLSLSRRPWNLMLVKDVEVTRLLNLLDLTLMAKAPKEKHRMVPEGH